MVQIERSFNLTQKNMLLGFEKTKQLLEKYGLPITKTILVKNESELSLVYKEIGFPLVLKVASMNVLHRTEKKLLKTNIQNDKEAKQALAELILKSKNDKGFEGILVQEQLQGLELFCGLKQDQAFGSIIMFGLGGIFVEALQDIAYGICPITAQEAKNIIASLKGKKVLQGFRGLPPVDLDVLADILVKISLLGAENPRVREVDFNPIIAKGKTIKIVDIKIQI